MSRILPLVLIILAFAIGMLYIRPTFVNSVHDTSQQIDSYNAALAAADRFQQKEAELTQQRAQIPPESLARLNEFLPDNVNNVQLILDMDALAARSGVTLSDFNTDNSGQTAGSAAPDTMAPSGGASALTSSSPVDSLNLTFKASGSYPAFRSFLNGIENSLRPLDVTSLSVSESSTGVYAYSVTVRIYWLR